MTTKLAQLVDYCMHNNSRVEFSVYMASIGMGRGFGYFFQLPATRLLSESFFDKDDKNVLKAITETHK